MSSIDRIFSHSTLLQLLLNVFNFVLYKYLKCVKVVLRLQFNSIYESGVLVMPCTSDEYMYFCHHHVVPIFPSYIITFCYYYHCQQSLAKARKKEQLKRTVYILKLKVSVFDVYLCIWMYTSVYLCIWICMWFVAWADQSAKCVYLSYNTLVIIIEICRLVA